MTRAKAPRPPTTTPMKRSGKATSGKPAVRTCHESTVAQEASRAIPAIRSWWGRFPMVAFNGRLLRMRWHGSA